MGTNVEAEGNYGKVSAKAPIRKELICKFCNKKFSNYQALGGHQNAHKEERAAAQKEKILSMASAYNKNSYVDGFVNSNLSYGFGGKTLGVSPLSMTRFKPHYSNWPHMGLKHDYHHHHHVQWSGYHTLNSVQSTIHQLQTLMAEGSGFDQHHKSYQPLSFPILRGEALNPNLCDKGNSFDKASNSSIIPQNAVIEGTDLNDHENSGEPNGFSSISANGVMKELDLTLKI